MRFFPRHRVAAVKPPGGVIRHHLYLMEPQYLRPLLIITDVNLGTAVAGIKGMSYWRRYHAMGTSDGGDAADPIPPVVIVSAMRQRAFVRGPSIVRTKWLV